MKRLVVFLAVPLLLLAAGAALVLWRIDADFVSRTIADAVMQTTGTELVFTDKPDITFLPPEVETGRVHWSDTATGAVVDVASCVARLELMPLLSGQLVIHEIQLHKPVLELHDAKAKPASAAVPADPADPAGQAQTAAPEKPQAPAIKMPPADTLPVELVRLLLDGGSIVHHAADGSSTRLHDINLSIENLRSRSEASLKCDFGLDVRPASAQGTAPATDVSGGNLALDTKLLYKDGQLAFRRLALTFSPHPASRLSTYLPAQATPVQLSATGVLDVGQGLLTVAASRLSLPQGRLSFSGKAWLTRPAVQGVAHLEGSPRQLLALARISLPPHPKDSINGKATLLWQDQTLDLSNIVLQMDDIQAQGALKLALAPMRLTGELKSSAVRLEHYLPVPPQGVNHAPQTISKKDQKTDQNTGQNKDQKTGQNTTQNTAATAPPWPAVDVAVRLDALHYGQAALQKVRLRLHGQKGHYALQNATAQVSTGGTLSLNATASSKAPAADMTQPLSYSLSAQGKGIALGPLLQALQNKAAAVEGLADFNADLHTTGSNGNELVAALAGKGLVQVSDMHVPSLDKVVQSIPALSALKAVPRRFGAVHAPFTIAHGQLHATPVTVQSKELTARGQACADLPARTLHATAQVQTMGLDIPLIIKGPWASPSVSVDPKFAVGLGRELGRAIGNTGQNAGRAVQENTPSANSVQRGLREAGGLLRGIFRQ